MEADQAATRMQADDQIKNLVASVAGRKVPVGSFSRIWALGTLQARIAAEYLAYWLRSLTSPPDERQRLKNEAHLAAALNLLGTMGYLRGAIMKVGQFLANLPDVVPEQFAEVLGSLHFEAPPMHFSLVRELFVDELGRDPEEIFARFDRQAFAAASLGQVHRATLHTGEEVAVKIQYPGIARTINSDFKSLRLLLQPLCLTRDGQNLLEKLDDIEQMLLIETDYSREASNLEMAGALFSPDEQIVIPRIYRNYSSGKILTTEYLAGCHLPEFLKSTPDQEERNRFADLLTVATFRMYYRLHWLFADPHPGNIIFMPNGSLGMIDFGCIRQMTEQEWEVALEAEHATLAADDRRLDLISATSCLFQHPDEMTPEHLQVIRNALNWQMAPWLKEGKFDFGDKAFFLRGIHTLMEMTSKRYTRSMPLTVWSTRFLLGGRALCYRLEGHCAFQSIQQQEYSASLSDGTPEPKGEISP